MSPLLLLDRVCKRYPGGNEALKNVTLQIHAREHVAIIGPSGGGKSSLLNVMATLDNPTSGEYHFDGKVVFGPSDVNRGRWGNFGRERRNAMLRRRMGFVFQTPFMLANFDVSGNITLAHRILNGNVPEPKITTEMLGALRLAEKDGQSTETLSGGERQRVAIGRALLHAPKVVFADEPTGSLDIETTDKIFDLLLSQCRKTGSALVLVTHNPEIASRMPRCIGIKEGKVMLDKTPVKSELEAFLRT